jgi:two-component system sensor histidine kinase UhpB
MKTLRIAALTLVLGGAAHAAPAEADRSTAADTGPVLDTTKAIAIGLGIVAALMGVLLYVVPKGAVEKTKKRVESVMAERALTLQEEDRRRIARELHDGAGQALTAARLQLAALRDVAEPHEEAIRHILSHVDEAIEEVRRSTTALAPPAIAEFGLAGAIERHCESFASASGLPVDVKIPERLPPMREYLETACYRITQEALSNAARHAGARRAWVTLDCSPEAIRLEVGDDGVGLRDGSGGFGLESIRERARLAGGSVEVQGPGTRIHVVLPVESPA